MFCLCLIEEIIDEEEFDLLYEAYRPRNHPFPHSANAKFSFVNKEPVEGKADFRVEKRDIPLLFDVFSLPQWNRVSDLQVPSVYRSSARGML